MFCGCESQTGSTGDVIFRYNQPNPISSLDPAFARNQTNIWGVEALFNGLVQLDDSLLVKPCIAKSWELDASRTIYTFHLRDDVFFHNDACFKGGKGRKVVAKDFEYSLSRVIDPAVGSPGSWIFIGRVDSIKPFRTVNDSTFQIKLQQPFMPFLQILSMNYCNVVPIEALEMYGKEFRSHPVGTGPFVLSKWLEGQAMILRRNPSYFEVIDGQRLPYVDGVRISFIGDRKTAFLQLLEGNLDFVNGFDPGLAFEILTRDGQLQSKYQSNVNLYRGPYLSTEYLGINLAYPESTYLKQKAFRQALNYAIDRPQLLQVVKRGLGHPAFASFAPKGLPTFDEGKVKGYNYNPTLARSLLKQSGYYDLPEDQRKPLALFTSKEYSDMCLFVVKQWEKVGIKCRVELAESVTVREMMRTGKVLFFRGNWMADYPDAENFMTVFYGKNEAPPNYTRFSNPLFDQLYQASLMENDGDKRAELIHKMEQIIIDEAPVIMLFYDEVAIFTSKKIEHFRTNPLNILKVKLIKKAS